MILVLGGEGQVGYALLRSLAPLGRVQGVTREDGDLSSSEAVSALLQRYQPDCIVNAAAYTAVDLAESSPEAAEAMNARLPGQLATWAKANGALLVHYSTDYVYEGGGVEPQREGDATRPLSVYGKTKLKGDEAILAANIGALIFRTSWVYGARGRNFMLTMLRLASERDSLNVVADQWGAPTPAWLIAQVTAFAVRDRLLGRGTATGVYHLTCRGETTWCDFSKAIISGANALGKGLKMTADSVHPIPTSEYPAPAPRPMNSRLDVTKLEQDFGVRLLDWHEALQITLRDWAEYTDSN